MMKRCNAVQYIFFIACIFAQLAHASDASDITWTLGAEKFSFVKKETVTQSDDAVASSLPRIILEQLAENLEHVPTAQENLDRATYDLQRERINIFLQLSKEVQMRDALVLGNYSQKQLASKLREADKKIDALKIKIDESLAKETEEKEKAAPAIALEDERKQNIEQGLVVDDEQLHEEKSDAEKFRNLFRNPNANMPASKQVRLYKDDFSALYVSNALDVQHDSRAFENDVVAAGIDALVTGKLTVYGEYVSATVSLIAYPGARTIGTVTDVGSLSDIRMLGMRLARQLTPAIANSMPIELFFDVQPFEATQNITLAVDDIVYREVPERLVVQAGVHSILFSAPGFKQAGTTYGFRGRRSFKIAAALVKENPSTLMLNLKKPFISTVYANGEEAGKIDEENVPVKLTINDEPVLGQFITEDGSVAPFYIAYKLLESEASLVVNAQPFDRSAYIDKRRKMMYTSYSVLITSLLGTFFTYGTFHSQNIAAANGYVRVDSVYGWQIAAWACTGVSIGCGAWFIYELVRYFVAADKVLPARARPAKAAKKLQ